MVARRIVWMPPTLFGLVLIVFAISHVIPSDPARVMAGENAPPEQVQALRHKYGLDLPLPQQFAALCRRHRDRQHGDQPVHPAPGRRGSVVASAGDVGTGALCHRDRCGGRRAAGRGGGAAAQFAARSSGARGHRHRARHGGVLAGDPAAAAVLDVAGLDAGAGPDRWLGARSDHRLLHDRCHAARRLGDTGPVAALSRIAGADAGAAGDGDDRALHPRRRAERDVVELRVLPDGDGASRAGASCGNTSCAAR